MKEKFVFTPVGGGVFTISEYNNYQEDIFMSDIVFENFPNLEDKIFEDAGEGCFCVYGKNGQWEDDEDDEFLVEKVRLMLDSGLYFSKSRSSELTSEEITKKVLYIIEVLIYENRILE